MEAPKVQGARRYERFGIIAEPGSLRFVSRQEFDLLKQRHPRLIQMRAGDLLYLTEPPAGAESQLAHQEQQGETR